MDIQWYPGHMAKARRQMEADIKLVDILIEVTDARLPVSSRNPEIDRMAGQKKRIIILNKSDLADESVTAGWKDHYKRSGITAIALDSRGTKARKVIVDAVMEAGREKFERDRKKGILQRPVRVMVAGIPNSGKSTLINTVSGKACVKVGNRPGVTKSDQWIRLNEKAELLDTPGLLWPKFEDKRAGINLAVAGSINDEIIDRYELCANFCSFLKASYPGALSARYGVDESEDDRAVITGIAVNKKLLKKGGAPDEEKACRMLLDDFRSGRLGRISLERPDV